VTNQPLFGKLKHSAHDVDSEVHISEAVVLITASFGPGSGIGFSITPTLPICRNASPFMAFPPSMLPGFDRVGARLF
jgi:hypothetical protein